MWMHSLSPPLLILLVLIARSASPADLPPSAPPSINGGSDQSSPLRNSSTIANPAYAFNRGFDKPYQRMTILIAALFIAFLFLGFCAHYVTLRSCYIQTAASRNVETGLQDNEARHTGEEAARGLEAWLVRSLPIVKYSAKKEEQAEEGSAGGATAGMGKKLQECAVCLSEYEEGEEMKELPVCGHRFHKACIDMWLFSHTTCPICRLSLRKHLKGAPMKTSSTDQRASPRSPGPASHSLPRGPHVELTMPLDPPSASTSSGFHGVVVNSYHDVDADDAEDARNSSAALFPHFPSSA